VSVPKPVKLPQLFTVSEAARHLSVCRRTLERLIAAGEFPRPLKVGRSSRVMDSDVARFLERLNRDRVSP
jgi:excisionase family DNA binding protein